MEPTFASADRSPGCSSPDARVPGAPSYLTEPDGGVAGDFPVKTGTAGADRCPGNYGSCSGDRQRAFAAPSDDAGSLGDSLCLLEPLTPLAPHGTGPDVRARGKLAPPYAALPVWGRPMTPESASIASTSQGVAAPSTAAVYLATTSHAPPSCAPARGAIAGTPPWSVPCDRLRSACLLRNRLRLKSEPSCSGTPVGCLVDLDQPLGRAEGINRKTIVSDFANPTENETTVSEPSSPISASASAHSSETSILGGFPRGILLLSSAPPSASRNAPSLHFR